MNRNRGKQIGDYILWENDTFRVWDQVIMPGETVGPHVHNLDYFIVVLDPADVTAKMIGKNRDDVEMIQEGLVWVKGNGEKHTATNVDKGGRRWRNLIIELKRDGQGAPTGRGVRAAPRRKAVAGRSK